MARSMNPNSAGSQFFIMTDDAPHLDGMYASFGKVTSGMEEADRIVSVDRDMMDKPREDQVIKQVRVTEQRKTLFIAVDSGGKVLKQQRKTRQARIKHR